MSQLHCVLYRQRQIYITNLERSRIDRVLGQTVQTFVIYIALVCRGDLIKKIKKIGDFTYSKFVYLFLNAVPC
jgi:hypothetical protein